MRKRELRARAYEEDSKRRRKDEGGNAEGM